MLQFIQEEQPEFVRYVHYFDKEIIVDTVQELIGILSSVQSVDLFFTTVGGELPSMRVLLHFINQHPDIRIYLTDYIASAGTFLLVDCNKEVYLTEELDWILFHQADREFGGKFRKAVLDKEMLYQQTKESNNILADNYRRLGLTPKEIKEYFKGEDVILYRKDFGRLKVCKK